jgi:integrase
MQIGAVVARKLRDGELTQERAVSGFLELTALLKARRAPCPKRTSAKKLKGATHAEYRQIIGDFARRGAASGGLDRIDRVLASIVKVNPYVGLRPVEILNAQIVGRNLVVANAKNTNGRGTGKVRRIELGRLPLSIVKLLNGLLIEIRILFDETGRHWRRLLGRLGERLARVCARLGIRRWSLYTTRHVAIASWKKSGLSPVTTAALCGHASTRTARNHYAGGRRGWPASFSVARPETPNMANAAGPPAIVRQPAIAKSRNDDVISDVDEAPVFTMG